MSYSLTNPPTSTFPSARFPLNSYSPPMGGDIIPLTPDLIGYETNRERRTLAADLLSTSSSATFVEDTTFLPTWGWFSIDSERIFYTQKNDSTRTVSGLVRGADADPNDALAVPTAHSAGCTAYWNHMAFHINFLIQEFNAFEQWVDSFADATRAHDAAQDAELANHEARIQVLECEIGNPATDTHAQTGGSAYAPAYTPPACSPSGTAYQQFDAIWQNVAAFQQFIASGKTWRVQGGAGPATDVHTNDTVTFVPGTGIAITQSGLNITIANTASGGSAPGDNLGNHLATMDLDMACHAIQRAGAVYFCTTGGVVGNPPPTPTGSNQLVLYEGPFSSPTGPSRRLFFKTASGETRMLWTDVDDVDSGGGSGAGDFLGPASGSGGASPASHTAGQPLNMNGFNVTNAVKVISNGSASSYLDFGSGLTTTLRGSGNLLLIGGAGQAELTSSHFGTFVPMQPIAGFLQTANGMQKAQQTIQFDSSSSPMTFTVNWPAAWADTAYEVIYTMARDESAGPSITVGGIGSSTVSPGTVSGNYDGDLDIMETSAATIHKTTSSITYQLNSPHSGRICHIVMNIYGFRLT